MSDELSELGEAGAVLARIRRASIAQTASEMERHGRPPQSSANA